MPAIVVVVSCQPINHDGPWELDHPYTIQPFLWLSLQHSQVTSCVVWSISYYRTMDPSTHPLRKFPYLLTTTWCIMLSQSGSWLFSKFSSNFRHFACSLHVMLMLPFSAWFWFWMRWEFEGQNENQKQFSYPQNHFLGVSQSDFIFRKLFLWMITQKRSLKLNWQPLLYIIFFTQAAHGPYM